MNAGNIVNELTLPELYAELSKTGVYSLASCSPCMHTARARALHGLARLMASLPRQGW